MREDKNLNADLSFFEINLKTKLKPEEPVKIPNQPNSEESSKMENNSSFFVDLSTIEHIKQNNRSESENSDYNDSDSSLGVPSFRSCETRIMDYTEEELVTRSIKAIKIDPINMSIDAMQSFDKMPQIEREKTFVSEKQNSVDSDSPRDSELDKTITPEKLHESLLSDSQKLRSPQIFPVLDQIPNLPSGKLIKIKILNNWGDENFVALTGLEIFNSDGQKLRQKHEMNQVSVFGPELNPNDPRSNPQNIINGKNAIRDALNSWMAPLMDPKYSAKNEVSIKLKHVQEIALIRVFNYGKSRVESLRGIKHVLITLDGELIFSGEISQSDVETILFTMDEDILEKISKSDDKSALSGGKIGGSPSPPVLPNPPKIERVQTSVVKPLKLARDKSFFKNQNTIQPQVTDVVRVQFLTNWSGERDCFTFRQISFTDGENCKVCPVKVVLKNCVVVGNEKDLERLSDKNAYR